MNKYVKYKRGSEWSKWDLHVHTPASIIQHFGGDDAVHWETYIKDLEKLPSEFKVLGINDYLFIDGYERLKIEKEQNGRLSNIELLLPVIEFRIEKFAGVDFGNLKRINLHVIFSNEVSIANIKSQFLNTLHQSYSLESGQQWNRAITTESLEELGNQVKSGTPAEKRQGLGSDLKLGFNNLNIDEKQIFEALKRDCFKNKYLIAVGKTEWAELKWTEASIATKKSIIQGADIVFTAAKTVAAFNTAKTKLTEQGVKDLLLDCSDAHYLSSSTESERIGHCYTWIKADTTFEGLKQIIYEPEKRIFIGDLTPLERQKKVCISKIEFSNSNNFPIHNQSVDLNRDLVCIIGGRGSGKSALFESVAFCFDQHKSNSIDAGKKYDSSYGYDRKTFIDYYKAESDVHISLTFTDKDFNTLPSYNSTLKQKGDVCSYPFLYLGQNQIEHFADNPDEIHRIAFDTIIKQTSQSGDLFSFQSKIEQKKQELIDSNKEIERLRLSIASYDGKKLDEDKRKIESELQLLSSKETKEIIEDFNKSRVKREDLRKIEELVGEIALNTQTPSQNNSGKILQIIEEFEKGITSLINQANQLASQLNQNANVISWTNLLDLKTQLITLKSSIDKGAVLAEYATALGQVEAQLTGKTDISVSYLESQKNRETEIRSKIDELQKLKAALVVKEGERETILNSLHQLYSDYELAYSSAIQEFNSQNQIVLKGIKMEAKKVYLLGKLVSLLWKLTDGRKSKDQKYFKESWMMVADDAAFDLVAWYKSFIANEENQKVFLSFDKNQIDSIVFADYNSLETKISYEIEAGMYKPIYQLSLGQKGTVLLKFYLASGNDCPILIDQPEDHLDNDFIYKDLVQTIRNAKEKRQIIIVTHDANLVVNGDAEQIIIANYKDQKINHTLSGSLENPQLRVAVTRILEGGDEAFKKRELKYQFVD